MRTPAKLFGLGVLIGAFLGPGLSGAANATNLLPDRNHWSVGDRPRAWIYVGDYTPAKWPVGAALSDWAAEPRLDFYYFSDTCGGVNRCVDVRLFEPAGPCNDLQGQNFWEFDNNHYTANGYDIRLNVDCGNENFWTDRDRRALACHELGHLIGLAHDFSANKSETCMETYVNLANRHTDGRPHDFTHLHDDIYNHNN